MESTNTFRGRRPQDYPGYALAEILAELIANGWMTLEKWLANAAQARLRARARRELRQLSDRSLRDIGIERGQIERLFD